MWAGLLKPLSFSATMGPPSPSHRRLACLNVHVIPAASDRMRSRAVHPAATFAAAGAAAVRGCILKYSIVTSIVVSTALSLTTTLHHLSEHFHYPLNYLTLALDVTRHSRSWTWSSTYGSCCWSPTAASRRCRRGCATRCTSRPSRARSSPTATAARSGARSHGPFIQTPLELPAWSLAFISFVVMQTKYPKRCLDDQGSGPRPRCVWTYLAPEHIL